MIETLFPITAVAGAVTLGLLLNRAQHEKAAALDLIDEERGRLHQGKRLNLETLHRNFAQRRKELPTLLAVVSHSCEFCRSGFTEVAGALPPAVATICVGYIAHEGCPPWLHEISRANTIVAPLTAEAAAALHLKMVPRWIWVSPANRVASDQGGFVEELTVRQLLHDRHVFLEKR